MAGGYLSQYSAAGNTTLYAGWTISDNDGYQLALRNDYMLLQHYNGSAWSNVWAHYPIKNKTISNQTTNGNGLLLLDLNAASTIVLEVRPSGENFGVPVALNNGSWYAIIQDFAGTRKTNFTLSAHVTYMSYQVY